MCIRDRLKLGIVAEPVRWLSNVWTARGLVGLMNFLMWFGNTTIILMAAIMGGAQDTAALTR